MTDNNRHDSDGAGVESDGAHAGTATDRVDYLDREVNLLRPSTPFMRDHLRLIWTGFVAWAVVVFGPVTATALAPGLLTTRLPVLGFPLHYFLVAVGAPGGSLLLAFWYTRRRDRLDQEYGIEHGTVSEAGGGEEVAAADGGLDS